MTRSRLLGQQERVHWTGLHRLLDRDGFYDQVEAARSAGGERKRVRAREAGPPRREEGWALEEGGRRDSWYWRGCRGCGGRSALVGSVCTVMLVETWTSGLGSKPGLKPRPTSVRLVPRIHAHTQGGHELFVLGSPGGSLDRFIDASANNSHLLSQGECVQWWVLNCVISGLGLGLGNCNCLTRTGLLCQKERRLKKQRVRVRVRVTFMRDSFRACLTQLPPVPSGLVHSGLRASSCAGLWEPGGLTLGARAMACATASACAEGLCLAWGGLVWNWALGIEGAPK